MLDFSEIKWEVWETKSNYNDHPYSGTDSFEFFMNYCHSKLPTANLQQSFTIFVEEKKRLAHEVRASMDVFAQQPFLTPFLVWIKEDATDPATRLAAKTLLECGFIGIKNKEGKIWTVESAKYFDQRNVVEAIRCHKDFHFKLKENLVKIYLDFMHWVSKATFGYIEKVEDPDLWRSKGRALAHPIFINFISRLKEEDQLIAKMLYFGGTHTLDEVLKLDVSCVDFKSQLINFGMQPTSYPLHVFADVKKLLGERTAGNLFSGRRNATAVVNPATVFRNFKEAAIDVGLSKNFTPKYLTTNVQ